MERFLYLMFEVKINRRITFLTNEPPLQSGDPIIKYADQIHYVHTGEEVKKYVENNPGKYIYTVKMEMAI